MRNRIRSVKDLKKHIPSIHTQGIEETISKYPLAITPYYASLIEKFTLEDPIYSMCVARTEELTDPPFLMPDPLHETKDTPVEKLVHRYQDRALVMATTTCGMYCRYCTRKRLAGVHEEVITDAQLDKIVEYLSIHPEIKDVIISGGDPLTLSDNYIENILVKIKQVSSIDIIRIGTKVPVVMPMRITNNLVNILEKYSPLYVMTHFNHPVEITPEATKACLKIINSGIPMGNQSVLLRNVNDSPTTQELLCRSLIKIKVRPYYLYQCDIVSGTEHFRTPLSKGIEIMEYLRGRLSGIAIPQFVVDAPGGGGKIPVNPNYMLTSTTTNTVLRNYKGNLINYPEPVL